MALIYPPCAAILIRLVRSPLRRDSDPSARIAPACAAILIAELESVVFVKEFRLSTHHLLPSDASILLRLSVKLISVFEPAVLVHRF